MVFHKAIDIIVDGAVGIVRLMHELAKAIFTVGLKVYTTLPGPNPQIPMVIGTHTYHGIVGEGTWTVLIRFIMSKSLLFTVEIVEASTLRTYPYIPFLIF
tara:strand:+ start:77 stop:376 length:300 start_codon:yes stop_codon:yes gene_type:complete